MNGMAAVATRSLIQREIGDDRVCILTFDRPDSGANIFDAATMSELSEHVDAIERDNSVRGLIITSAKKSIFIAGADLKTLLEQAPTGEMRGFIAEGQRVFNRIAALNIPTVAAIHGACAGGGYEVTLACDWRVAANEPATRIGLPETTLGLIPAWGGSTRLPRLIGVENASEVILKGKLYSAPEALKLGLVDEVVPRDELLDAARRKLGQGKRAPAKASSPEGKMQFHGDPKSARARALGVINTGSANPLDESLRLELEAIVDLGKTESTQNLIRNFFLAEKYKKGTSKVEFPKVAHAAVIGAGVMGSGIAQWLSSRGVTVILRDVNRELLNRGLANIEKVYGDAVKRGLMTEEKASQGRSRIVASTAPMELRDVQFIVEAASEKMEIKKEIFRELSMQAGPKTIVATNTSALPVSQLAHCTVSADHVIGLHFFNPVSRMKLVEVVVAKETSEGTKEQSLAFVRQIAKVPVVVRDSPGFLVNRVLFPYLLDAAELFETGIGAERIDDALTRWGMPMGPLRLIDEIGIDVTIDIAATLEKAYGKRDRAAGILSKMREAKMLGRKSGSGFYKYGGKAQSPNESLNQWRQAGDSRGDGNSADGASVKEALANRLMFLMVNEAARCIEEKVVESPEDADYGMILGTGFAPHRGGPLRFADHFGLKKIADEMNRLGQTEEKFLPCEILKNYAAAGTTFYKS
jgi:3-hydroxyacyl-CoA dehydrogenase / enoyl-CoA hydratase / 3-hydroxybutyryl-CoA epimerase